MTCGVLRGFEPAAGFAARPAQPGALRRSGRTVLRWIERSRQRQALAALERHLLEDIGLTPEDARREAEKPMNAVEAGWSRVGEAVAVLFSDA